MTFRSCSTCWTRGLGRKWYCGPFNMWLGRGAQLVFSYWRSHQHVAAPVCVARLYAFWMHRILEYSLVFHSAVQLLYPGHCSKCSRTLVSLCIYGKYGSVLQLTYTSSKYLVPNFRLACGTFPVFLWSWGLGGLSWFKKKEKGANQWEKYDNFQVSGDSKLSEVLCCSEDSTNT